MAGGNQGGGRQRVNTSKSGNFKPAAGKAAQIKAAQAKAAQTKAVQSQAAQSQSSAARAAAARTGTARTGAARSGTARAGAAAAAPEAPKSLMGRLLAKNPPGLPPAPIWLQWTTFVLSLIGLGVSIYLTIEHFTTNSLAGCPENSTFNCLKVTTSPESMVFGVLPVAVLGLAFYVFLAVVNSPLGWRLDLAAIRWLRVGSLVVGIGFVLYLVYVELFQVNSICLYCTSVHTITFVLFVLVIFDATFRHPPVTAAAEGR
jgi:uncharacterized membrane protein